MIFFFGDQASGGYRHDVLESAQVGLPLCALAVFLRWRLVHYSGTIVEVGQAVEFTYSGPSLPFLLSTSSSKKHK